MGDGRKRPVICWETGVEYESATAAAKAVGVPNIGAALRSGSMAGGYHWYYKGAPKPDASTFKGNKAVVCWETDQVFLSTQEAADWAGTTVSGIYTALRTKNTSGGYHWYLHGNPRPEEFPTIVGGRNTRPVVCYETGQVFPSIRKAAEFAGVAGPSAIRWAMGECKNGQRRSVGGYHWYYADEPRPEVNEVEPKEKAPKKTDRPRKEPRKPRRVVCWETGAEYESADAAAASLGLKNSSGLRSAIRRGGKSGGYHWYFADHPKPKESDLKQPRNKKQEAQKRKKRIICLETGQAFTSVKEAGASIGHSSGTSISRALRTGYTAGGYHWYREGTPKPSVPEQANDWGKPGRRAKPVVCAETGKVYASVKDAATAVGVSEPKNVSNAIHSGGKSGGYHWYYEGADGPKKKQRKPRAVVCWETDEVFPSEEAAAEWAGTTAEAIDTVMRTHRSAGGYHWHLASKPKPDASELVERRRVVCYETGQVFPSINEAAEAVGVGSSSIYLVLSQRNYAAGGYHWYWEGDPKPDPSEFRPRKNHPIVCVETGKVYPSVTAAAKAIGTKSNSSLSRAARKGYAVAGLHWRYADEGY